MSATPQLFLRAVQAFQRANYGAAIAALQQQLQQRPDAAAYHLLALCYDLTKQTMLAEPAFTMALQLQPTQLEYLQNFCRFLKKHALATQATQLLQHYHVLQPKAPAINYQLAQLAANFSQTKTAETLLQQCLQQDPQHSAAIQLLAYLKREQGELEWTEKLLAQAVQLEPANPIVWINLSVVQRLLGKAKLAWQSASQAQLLNYQGPELLDALIGASIDNGNLPEAYLLIERLTTTFPEYVAGHTTKLHFLWEYGARVAPDLAPFSAVMQLCLQQPQHRQLHHALAGVLIEANQAEQALQLLQAVNAGQDPVSMALFADAYEQLQDKRAAIYYQNAYQHLQHNSVAFLNAYVRHLIRVEDLNQAEHIALIATERFPDDQEAWSYLALIWQEKQDPRADWLCDYEKMIVSINVPPPAGYNSMQEFLQVLTPILDSLHLATKEPLSQSLRTGSQTAGKLFGSDIPEIQILAKSLKESVEKYLQTLSVDMAHPFYRRVVNQIKFSGSWSVKLYSSGLHVNHIHSQGWLSSAFYVALPPAVQEHDAIAGAIQFGQPPTFLNLPQTVKRLIKPQPGMLVLFPSYFWHGTVPFVDTEPRLTVAFDMLPSGPENAS